MHIRAVERQDVEDEKRHKIRSASLSASLFANLMRKIRSKPFRKLLERLWGGPGALLDGSWALLARLGRPQVGLGPSFGCPQAVANASGSVPKTILDAQDASRSIVRRCWDDLAWISDDFRPNFRRFSVEPLATKPQNRRLEGKSCDPRCPT